MLTDKYSRSRRWFIFAAALVAVLLGLFVLIGWVADVRFLEALGPVRATMRTNAALAVVLAGLSLGALARTARLRSPQRRLGSVCAIGTLSIAALTLLQHAFAVDLGVDQLLLSNSSPPPAPGRMSKPAATGFLLLGVSLLLLHAGRGLRVAQGIALLSLLVSGFFCLGYLYRGPEFTSFGPFGPIALPTALALFVLSLGTLAASPNTGLVGLLTGNRVSSRTARLLIPAVVLVPVVASYARLEGQRAGWFDTEVGLALFTLSNVVALVALVWWSDSLIQRSKRLLRQAGESLHESEQRFRGVLEGVPHLVWTCRTDGPCDFLSRQWVEYTGRPEADHLGSGWQEAIHPDDRARLLADWQRVVATRAPFDSECRIRSAAGEYRWFRAQAVLIGDGDGGKWFGTNSDIHDKKRAEAQVRDLTTTLERRVAERTEALRESEERYRLAIRATNDAVWDIDVTNGTVHWSEKYTSTFGRPPETADSWQWWIDRIHPDDRDRTAGSLRAAVDGTVEAWASEYRFRLPNGEWADIRDRAYIARDPAGKAVRVVGAMQDVTAFRQAAAERDRMWTFSLDPMCVAGFDGFFKQVNPAWERTLGWTAEELTSRPWLDFVHPDDRQATVDVAGELVGGQLVYHFENRYRHRDGTYRSLSWNAYPLAEGETIFAIARDVTEQKRAEIALRESEERFRAMADAAPVLIWLADTTRRCVWFNRQWLEFVGRAMAQETGDGWVENVHPDDTARCFATYAEAFAARRPFTMEYRLRRHDGEYRWLLDIGVPRFDASGEFAGYIGSCVDITERLVAEKALRASEERLRLALSAGRMGIFDWDPATNAIVWSDTHYELFGYPSGERFPVEYHHFTDRVHPEDRSAVEQVIRTAMDQHSTYKSEYRIVLPDGNPRWIQGIGEFQYDSDARPVRMLGTVSDITERKQAEAELLMRDRAIQAVNHGIVITDPNRPDNPVIYASPGIESMTGYAPAEFVGRNCRFLQGPDTDQAEVARIAAAIRDGVPYSGELLNCRKDGSTFWNELSITPVRDPAGRLMHFVGIQADVTARRSLEDQLRQAQKMEAVGQLAGGVAHDFNNLLTVINGYSEMLLTELSPDHPQRDPLAGIREAGERAAALTQQLLAFSRRTIVAPRVLDVNELIDSSTKMLRRLIGEDITLATVLSPAPCYVRIDPGQLEQVVMNLVVNARDAMPKGGRITFETNPIDLLEPNPDCPAGRYVCLAVTDTGTGMTEEVKKRLFEPFFTTKGVGKGTGLGLAMVYGVVRQAGGSVEIDSTVGRGTTFTLLLPEVPATAAERSADVLANVIPRGTETILLVEDEDGVRAFSRLVLEMQGYTVVEAESGTEAIAAATSYPETIHLIVTDVVMPDLGGRDLTEQIRGQRPAVRVLYVSGYTSDAVLRHGVEEETDAFLQKPFTPLSLARKIREVLDAPRPE